MNLKIVNVMAVTFVMLALCERMRGRKQRPFLLAAMALDIVILATLMGPRGAADTAGALAMTPVRLVHIGTSALFPLAYPFLLLGDPDEAESAKATALALGGFALLRMTSFWTSYFMGTVN